MADAEPASPMDFANARAKPSSPEDRLPSAEVAVVAKPSKLDSQKMVDLHRKLMSFYTRELRRQAENREQMALDEDFFDNIQWAADDAKVLRDRGQVPIVYNVIAPTIQWIIGTEKRSRTDFKVLPRRKDASKPAERKSQLMKYLGDVNRSSFAKSDAFEDATKVGVGWLEVGVQSDDDGEPIYDMHESWRNMLWDSASAKKDLSDCRYMCRSKWVDEDVAHAMFPGRKGVIDAGVVNADSVTGGSSHGDEAMDAAEEAEGGTNPAGEDEGFGRPRVRLIEVWYRSPVEVQRIRGGDFSGETFDETHDGHVEDQTNGIATVVLSTTMRMHVAVMTIKGLLYASETPYRHNGFPFSPIWCNRRGRDGMPYGVIRGLRDIQADVNKRASKALHILSTSKTIMSEGAVEDVDKFIEEVARPDAVIVKKVGAELTISADRDLAPAHLELMSRSIAMIQSASGVTDENMGRRSNATSGVAIQARQSQGSLATAGLFDNLRFAAQMHGEKTLSLIEQFFDEKKSFRITNMRGTPEYVTVNDGLPENDIVRSKADFVISEDDWRTSVRQAQTTELLALLQQLAPVAPQIAVVMLDLLVEAMDIPNRDEIVRRIRQTTGMRDPDAEEPTQEEMAKAQAAAEQAGMQKAMLQAQIAGAHAQAEQRMAAAQKASADAQKVLASIAGTNVDAQQVALQTALAMIASPAAVPVADGVLHEAGFRSRTEQEDDAKREAAMQAAQAQQQAQQAEQQQAAMQEQQAAQQGGEQPGAQPMGPMP